MGKRQQCENIKYTPHCARFNAACGQCEEAEDEVVLRGLRSVRGGSEGGSMYELSGLVNVLDWRHKTS